MVELARVLCPDTVVHVACPEYALVCLQFSPCCKFLPVNLQYDRTKHLAMPMTLMLVYINLGGDYSL